MSNQTVQTEDDQTVAQDQKVNDFLSQIPARVIADVDDQLAAAGIRPVVQEKKEEPSERPAPAGAELKALQAAKQKLARAEKNLKEYESLVSRFLGFLKKESRAAVEREFEEARTEYEKLKAQIG